MRLYGFCLEPPRVCLVLELMPWTLQQRVHHNPMQLARAVTVDRMSTTGMTESTTVPLDALRAARMSAPGAAADTTATAPGGPPSSGRLLRLMPRGSRSARVSMVGAGPLAEATEAQQQDGPTHGASAGAPAARGPTGPTSGGRLLHLMPRGTQSARISMVGAGPMAEATEAQQHGPTDGASAGAPATRGPTGPTSSGRLLHLMPRGARSARVSATGAGPVAEASDAQLPTGGATGSGYLTATSSQQLVSPRMVAWSTNEGERLTPLRTSRIWLNEEPPPAAVQVHSRLSLREVLSLAADIAAGLAYLHSLHSLDVRHVRQRQEREEQHGEVQVLVNGASSQPQTPAASRAAPVGAGASWFDMHGGEDGEDDKGGLPAEDGQEEPQDGAAAMGRIVHRGATCFREGGRRR